MHAALKRQQVHHHTDRAPMLTGLGSQIRHQVLNNHLSRVPRLETPTYTIQVYNHRVHPGTLIAEIYCETFHCTLWLVIALYLCGTAVDYLYSLILLLNSPTVIHCMQV